jgi:hypothetical protein
MYLDTIPQDEMTQVFVGTATEVQNHTQVVTVSESLKGWVSSKVWVIHPWSSDWSYFCSSGPAKKGVKTVFITTIDQYGSYTVTQTLPYDSKLAKDLIADLKKAEVESGVTEATAEERAEAIRQSIFDVLKAVMNLLAELRYWQSEVR